MSFKPPSFTPRKSVSASAVSAPPPALGGASPARSSISSSSDADLRQQLAQAHEEIKRIKEKNKKKIELYKKNDEELRNAFRAKEMELATTQQQLQESQRRVKTLAIS